MTKDINLPRVVIFSKNSYWLDNLKIYLKNKDFEVKINPRKIREDDYIVIDFFSGLHIGDYKTFLERINNKCLAIIASKQQEIKEFILKNYPNIGVGVIELRPDRICDYSQSILKELLSFGHAGKAFKLNGQEIKTIKISNNDKTEPKNEETSFLNKKLTKFYKAFLKKTILLLSLFIGFFTAPILILFFSVILLFGGTKIFLVKPDISKKMLDTSVYLANITKEMGFYYTESEFIYKAGQTSQNLYVISDIISDILEGSLSTSSYNLTDLTVRLSAEMDSLYSSIGFLQGYLRSTNSIFIKNILNFTQNRNIRIDVYMEKVHNLRIVASRLDDLMGINLPKKYLVLFQNNMELRPTGGFIGSFALVTLNSGKITDITVSDVYSADGQLKGHVEPPKAIKEILGEGGWYLRDANWDPNFPSSASKIEWFLDKEIGEKVDGVIAIDLYFIKDMLKVTGPIKLPDYNNLISSENVYEITQSEVEDDFFAGSRKKSNFLTSLSRQFIFELQNMEMSKRAKLAFNLYKNMNEKHIQFFIHDTNIAGALEKLGIDGLVNLDMGCGERCIKSGYYLVDANLGVNKANYYINRNQVINISPNKENISHELLVTYSNSAKKVLGKSGVYKSFTRLLLPKDAQLEKIRQYDNNGGYKDLEFVVDTLNNRKEAGFVIDVLPESSVMLQLFWYLPHQISQEGGEYKLKVFKQPGTDMDSLEVGIKQGEMNVISQIPLFSLTKEGNYLYNTNLRTDFEASIFLR